MGDVDGGLSSDHSSSENLFLFYESVPTLQVIASHELALHLWLYYIDLDESKAKSRSDVSDEDDDDVSDDDSEISDYLCLVFNLDEDYASDSWKLIESLKLSRCIEKILIISMQTIRNEMEEWIRHFDEKIFPKQRSHYRLRNFNPNHCVWFQNGKINYKRSASKILSEGKLEAEQKFMIMCFYGMADELKKFPVNSLPDCFIQRNNSNFEISYWIYYLRNQVHKVKFRISKVIFLHSYNESYVSFDFKITMWCFKELFLYACEYFWSRLNENEQVAAADVILHYRPAAHLMRRYRPTWEFQKFILPKMTPSQQRQLIDRVPTALMVNSIDESDTPENALVIWTRVKHRIEEFEFVEFLDLVYEDATYTEKCMNILNNIWDTASNGHKKCFAEDAGEIMYFLFDTCFQRSASGLAFAIKVLSMASEHTRNYLIMQHNLYCLVTNINNFDAFSRILEFCSESDRSQFKNSIIESDEMVKHCLELLQHFQFDELVAKVAFYSPNADITRKFINKLLRSDTFDLEKFILDGELWNKFSNFINAVFPNNLSIARELKKQLILSKKPLVCVGHLVELFR
ncbi:uncharacterized protein LOC135840274 isoform X2 [Planococcus citri]|uniref:uncharacterized protein LOC135840274 isoform X2 n=1 Tax=Planococcus citri TaxID=170843 RepID=UPI0031F86236